MTSSQTAEQSLRVSYVATSDSFLKWVAGLYEAAPVEWQTELVLLKHADNPSQRQREAALAGHSVAASAVRLLSIRKLLSEWRKSPPNVVVIGAAGPFLLFFRWLLDRERWGRQVALCSGSPGVALHLSDAALKWRSVLDVLVVASVREREQLGGRLQRWTQQLTCGLVALPFLESVRDIQHSTGARQQLVFVPQPDMPASKQERIALIRSLIELKRTQAPRRVVVKLRAVAGERQTHIEHWPYQQLFAELVSLGDAATGEIEFVAGPMSQVLAEPDTVVASVSSTAILEAIAAGCPSVIIADFGVTPALANDTYEGSGLLSQLSELQLPLIRKPNPDWLQLNYFHTSEQNDLQAVLAATKQRRSPSASAVYSTAELLRVNIIEGLRTFAPNLGGGLLRRYNKVRGPRQ